MSKKTFSPCCGICRLNLDGTHCLGCRRSLEEIANWLHYTHDQKNEIYHELSSRLIR
jgi:predicted Fe-S protein YdhL (DUF1289 family)